MLHFYRDGCDANDVAAFWFKFFDTIVPLHIYTDSLLLRNVGIMIKPTYNKKFEVQYSPIQMGSSTRNAAHEEL
jgi:hypothetical protein